MPTTGKPQKQKGWVAFPKNKTKKDCGAVVQQNSVDSNQNITLMESGECGEKKEQLMS